MNAKKYYIRERDNPQLGTYFIAMGQLSKTAAKKYENALYGSNTMHSFDTAEAYAKRLQELNDKGEKVQ